MLYMFCVDCGEEKEIFRDGSCLQCYFKNHTFTKGPDVFDIPHCVHCDAYKYKNLWHYDSFNDTLIKYIKQNFSISRELKDISFSINCDDEENIKACSIDIIGLLEGQTISEPHTITVRIKQNVCDVCSRQFGGYHEAIMQIRPGNRKISNDKLVDIQWFVEDHINVIQKKNKNLFLSDMGREHGGLDFFLSDKQAAFTIIKKIQEKYGGYITTSSKNVGIKDGKQLYRDTYLLRFLHFEKGDILKFEESYFFVSKISRNNIHLIKLDSNEKKIHEASDIDNAIVVGSDDLVKEMIVVSTTNEEIQVMDQKSYNILILKKPKDFFIENETVSVIFIDEEHIYLHPSQNQK